METQQIQAMTITFEGHAQRMENGLEYWLARDLQHLLGYTKWDNFLSVISKARTACEVSGHAVADHFADVGKMIELDARSNHPTPAGHPSFARRGVKNSPPAKGEYGEAGRG